MSKNHKSRIRSAQDSYSARTNNQGWYERQLSVFNNIHKITVCNHSNGKNLARRRYSDIPTSKWCKRVVLLWYLFHYSKKITWNIKGTCMSLHETFCFISISYNNVMNTSQKHAKKKQIELYICLLHYWSIMKQSMAIGVTRQYRSQWYSKLCMLQDSKCIVPLLIYIWITWNIKGTKIKISENFCFNQRYNVKEGYIFHRGHWDMNS